MRLPPEVNRALYVRNLPFKITAEEMYDIFGKFGAIRQIRLGSAQDTRGTAFVVYEDIYDAKTAVDHLSGFNVCGRYLVVLYYQQTKMQKRLDTEREAKEVAEMRARLGIDGGVHRPPPPAKARARPRASLPRAPRPGRGPPAPCHRVAAVLSDAIPCPRAPLPPLAASASAAARSCALTLTRALVLAGDEGRDFMKGTR